MHTFLSDLLHSPEVSGSGAGLWGLFLATFLAATILPFSSEAVLAAMAFGPWSSFTLLVVASLGNWLGGLSTFGLGWLGNPVSIARWLRMDPAKAVRWQAMIQRRGAWLALLCWVPVIGDPIALALGIYKAHPVRVAALMLIGKAVRYAAVIAVLREVL
ncbi:MAG: VTT domain-containing protein [Flavobacteriales bacterium]